MKIKKFSSRLFMIIALLAMPFLSGCSIEEIESALGLDVPK